MSNDSTVAIRMGSTLVSAGTSFTDTGVPINVAHYYWLKACNDHGCSDYSSALSATALASDAPQPI